MVSSSSSKPRVFLRAPRGSLFPGESRGWTWLWKLFRVWKRLQVSYYGGKYSVHRLLALEEYTRKTSILRVCLVCMGTPLPTVAIILIQESIPLQDPAKGWQENYGFWIRAAILATVIARVVADQTRYFIDDFTISWCQVAVLSACTSLVFTTVAALLSAHLMFPVPFFVLTLAPVFYMTYVLVFRVVMGRQVALRIMARREQLFQYIAFLGAQNIMACTYPAYEALFRVAQGTYYQLPVIFLLPVIKVLLRNVVLKCAGQMEDMAPEAVIFTVDFFNSVYVSSCMQSASSPAAAIAITVTDLSQTAFMLYGLHRRTEPILPRLRQTLKNDDNVLISDSLLSSLTLLCRDAKHFEAQARTGIRVYSCLPHNLSPESKLLLDKLDRISLPLSSSNQMTSGPVLSTLSSPSLRFPCLKHRENVVHPVVIHPDKRTGSLNVKSQIASKMIESFTKRSTVLRETLEILFSIECLVVSAFLEAATPLLYGCYVLVMVHLPSSRYHAELAGVTSENAVSTVQFLFIFALFQVASFVLLASVIKRNCGINALYHLTFVMETQMSLIQGKLMAWMVVTLCFRVIHFGVDFTFRFNM